MNQKFHAAIQQRDDVTFVKLSGVIDEDNELAGLSERILPGTAVISLGEIERINSCGVRDWVNWLGRVEKNGTRVVLIECSPAIVAQINLVNNFSGGGAVKSFFAPYYCPNCDREKVLLVEAGDLGPPPHRAPVCRCDECDGVMDFDDMEDSYFAFLASARRVTDRSRIDAIVKELSPSDGDRGKIRSRVTTSSTSVGAGTLSSLSGGSFASASQPATRSGGGSFSGGGFHTPQVTTSRSFSAPGTGQATPSGVGPGSNPGSFSGVGLPRGLARPEPASRSNLLIYVLVGVLLLAIGVLAYLLLSGRGT